MATANKYGTWKKNVTALPLVDPQNVFLPALHIKLGLVKSFIKELVKQSPETLLFLKEKFPTITEAKLKEGVFVGPDIRKLMLDVIFENKLSNRHLKTWKSVKNVINNFLGNTKSENYVSLVEEMLENFKEMKVNMSLKIHIMHSHLNFFPENLGAVSDEHGERFHQEIAELEKRYSKCSSNMLADYCWSVISENCTDHKKKAIRKSFQISDQQEQ